ncbi:GNAT family N-acetyltransferase [Kitasatospora sp. NPDC058965]|uniref:GNAT family N-acetyltransferase n=1 Tax=Kitasatospora sp. NPDC058965 TaxID=3346682 RepID=UPI0036878996
MTLRSPEYVVRPVQPDEIDSAAELLALAGTQDATAFSSILHAFEDQVRAGAPKAYLMGALVAVAPDGTLAGAALAGPVAASHWAKDVVRNAGLTAEQREIFPEILAEMTDLGVHPDHRRRGVGRQLVAEVHRWAGKAGYRGMVWFFPTYRADALAFHEAAAPVTTKPGKRIQFRVDDLDIARDLSDGGLRAAFAPVRRGVKVGWDVEGNMIVVNLWPETMPTT